MSCMSYTFLIIDDSASNNNVLSFCSRISFICRNIFQWELACVYRTSVLFGVWGTATTNSLNDKKYLLESPRNQCMRQCFSPCNCDVFRSFFNYMSSLNRIKHNAWEFNTSVYWLVYLFFSILSRQLSESLFYNYVACTGGYWYQHSGTVVLAAELIFGCPVQYLESCGFYKSSIWQRVDKWKTNIIT